MGAKKQTLKPKVAAPSADIPREDKWPATSPEVRAITKLKAYERNARIHSEAQVKEIIASIKEWGWTIPVLIDEKDGIIAGHGRVLAAKKLGITNIPVIVAKGWTEMQKRAYVIADNKLTMNGSWDRDLLRLELSELDDEMRKLTAFNDAEYAALLATLDEVNDPAKEWEGMPEFKENDETSFRSIVVHFASQSGVDAFSELIGQPFGPAIKSIWHPKAETGVYADKKYDTDAES